MGIFKEQTDSSDKGECDSSLLQPNDKSATSVSDLTFRYLFSGTVLRHCC